MSFYRRSLVPGGTYFFTLTLADRRSQLLVEQIERLRTAYGSVQQKYPFETVAICVLPEHLHAIWTMPLDDGDYSRRWNLIKGGFSRGLPSAPARSDSKLRQREKAFGKNDFGSIKFAMKTIYSDMWILCISIRSSTAWCHR